MQPTLIYSAAVSKLLNQNREQQPVHGIAHITGGGLAENIERILPSGVAIEIDTNAWETPAVFPWLQELGKVDVDEMFRVFNMGIGLTLIVAADAADDAMRVLNESGHHSMVIGNVSSIDGDSKVVVNR